MYQGIDYQRIVSTYSGWGLLQGSYKKVGMNMLQWDIKKETHIYISGEGGDRINVKSCTTAGCSRR